MNSAAPILIGYDGSRTAFESSTNYSLQEYARDIVYNIMDVCDSEKVAHPAIISAAQKSVPRMIRMLARLTPSPSRP